MEGVGEGRTQRLTMDVRAGQQVTGTRSVAVPFSYLCPPPPNLPPPHSSLRSELSYGQEWAPRDDWPIFRPEVHCSPWHGSVPS